MKRAHVVTIGPLSSLPSLTSSSSCLHCTALWTFRLRYLNHRLYVIYVSFVYTEFNIIRETEGGRREGVALAGLRGPRRRRDLKYSTVNASEEARARAPRAARGAAPADVRDVCENSRRTRDSEYLIKVKSCSAGLHCRLPCPEGLPQPVRSSRAASSSGRARSPSPSGGGGGGGGGGAVLLISDDHAAEHVARDEDFGLERLARLGRGVVPGQG